MLHFIVDGYNLINKIAEIKNLSLQDKRSYLIFLLEDFGRIMSLNNKISVVFDGREDVISSEVLSKRIEVIFSKGESADLLIKKLVKNSPHPRNILVITEDRAIISCVRSWGANSKKSSEFLKNLKRKLKKKEKKIEDNFKIDAFKAYQITEELRRIWEEKY
ncbi:MAG: hypothetical protein DRP80_03610 [Candidatus Omnitrophota bacterium]|nr:MAG: hypothetical protein DRP69_04580 [Candidatus Omnitrophota bacterium]RKY43993.1 MAG: hypothetical protein DRP80_03610 [Candidatus Omnitrophota bacterium]